MIGQQRPAIPASYGIATGTEGMLRWDDVARALRDATIYWVSTTRPDGSPHLIPIWGAWVNRAGYIEGGDETLWARNLASRKTVHVGVDHEGMQMMVRGMAARHDVDDATQVAIAEVYGSKYPYRPEGATFWVVQPTSVLAWSTSTVESFAVTPTEFMFEEAS